jgi:23S rRNA (pseudouridine1915-N3)-methyltransferase
VSKYGQRLSLPLKVTELPDKGGKHPPETIQTKTVSLDETGTQISSVELARQIEKWQDQGVREIRFLIGAADGLTSEERESADLSIAFGKTTWPHLLARAMLTEQLWRACSILANHPYHRDG